MKNEWKKCLTSGKRNSAVKAVVKKKPKRKEIVRLTFEASTGNLPDLRENNRNRALKTFYGLLSSEEAVNLAKDAEPEFEFSNSLALERAIDIERHLYADTSRNYVEAIRERILILKNKNNPGLKAALLLGSVSVQDFAEKDATELADEKTRKKLQEGKEWSMKA